MVLPLGRGESVEGVTGAAGVPVVQMVGRRWSETVGLIAAHRPDAVAVACFPWRLPAALLALPRLGCLNVHPALLPAGRGPEPVFWTLRRGERRTGATVHLMDAGFDTGPILAQAAVDVPLGVRAPVLERRLMEVGGGLLVEAIVALARGDASPRDQALVGPAAWDAPVPAAADYVVSTDRPARWAFGFARGVAPLGGPLELLVLATGARIPLADAVAWEEDGLLDGPLVRSGDGREVVARFRPGTARLLVAHGRG